MQSGSPALPGARERSLVIRVELKQCIDGVASDRDRARRVKLTRTAGAAESRPASTPLQAHETGYQPA